MLNYINQPSPGLEAINNRPEGVNLLDFNRRVEQEGLPSRLNEARLTLFFNELQELGQEGGQLHLLTMARLFELTLFTAGQYADCGEFSAAGDLLANPAQVMIHIRGRRHPVIKKRHSCLTEQFACQADERGGVIDWLKKETRLEIRREALLPLVFGQMRNSGGFSPRYLEMCDNRLKKTATLLGLIGACHLSPGVDFSLYLRNLKDADRRFLEANLCRFDLSCFLELGKDLRLIAHGRLDKSRFLA